MMGKCMFMRKGSVHTEPGLPAGYTKLAYIQSSGTQYVDTGCVLSANSKIECEFAYTKLTAQYSGIFISGCRFVFGMSSKHELYYANTVVTTVTATTDKTNIAIDGVSKTASVNGTSYTFSSPTYTAGTESLIIFALKRSATNIADYCYMRLYGYRVYDNGTLVRDYVPCITDGGEVGLYDLAEKKFYGNAGTGAFSGMGLDGVEVVGVSPIFANNDWATIIKACQKNKVPDTWVVGDSKVMNFPGAYTDYNIEIIGKNHDTYSDGSGTAPLTFQMRECYKSTYPMNSSNSNSGGWKNCAMRTTHLPYILTLMPSEVQAGVKEVNKLTSAGSASSTITTTADKLFLLSEIEIFGSTTYSYSGEGRQYAYYAAGNSKVKKMNGAQSNWWERSPHSNTQVFCYVFSSGTPSNGYATGQEGVAFAFCF